MSAFLEVEGLAVEIDSKEVLKGVSLQVAPGETVAIMGPNGSGKSTLVSTIMGKPGYRVTRGDIKIEGESILASTTDERSRMGLALISQYQPELPGLSLEGLIELALGSRGMEIGKVRELVSHEAGAIGFDSRLLARWVNVDLSGGERKKLETVLAAAIPSKLVIGDEIDSGLDVDALKQVAARLRRLRDEEGVALLLITHYPRLLAEIAPDRVVVLSRGEIVSEGGRELAVELERTGYGAFEQHDLGLGRP